MISIPEEKWPECFKDESRRNVLYSPLRSKSVNPSDWNTKISAWVQLINLHCRCNKVYMFSLESLQEAFRYQGRTPSCFTEVLDQMIMNREIEALDQFVQKKPKSWKEWVTKTFITTPMSWSFGKMKNLISSTNNSLYVPLKLLDEESNLLLNKAIINYKNKLVSFKDFLEMENMSSCEATNYKMLFMNLYKSGKVDMFEFENKDMSADNFLIKFSDGRELKPIVEKDMGLYMLEQNEKVLEKNIEILEDDVNKCIQEAKIHLSKGHRQLAKACLRKKHKLENRIDSKVKALHNVQILIHKLQDSELDESIWQSYKKALEAFETSYKTGINEDAVEDTMLKVGEMMEIHSDIQNALARPITDEDVDLEEELAQLVNNDDDESSNNKGSPQKETDEKLLEALDNLKLNLPSVPSSPIKNNSQDNNVTLPLS